MEIHLKANEASNDAFTGRSMIGMDETPARLTKFQWILLLGLAAIIAGLGVIFLSSPGYMDADYYFQTAKWIAEGFGFQEWILWNYLDDPQGIPHPSHLYWLPLTSILAAMPMRILGDAFSIAQIPFALMMVLLVLITTKTSLCLNRSQWMAVMSGLLAIFSGFYLPFFLTTDTFTPFALLGSLSLLLLSRGNNKMVHWLLAGLLIGLGHLTRADGVLLVLIAIIATYQPNQAWLYRLMAVIAGYLIVMLPWWYRNYQVVGTFMTPGSERVFWLLSYDDLFTYPASMLTFERWMSAGLLEIAGDRLQAFWTNIQSLIAVNGLIFLVPLVGIGLWQYRRMKLIQLSSLYAIALLLSMSVVFPYAGARGAYFHSSAALMPIFWAVAPKGLERSIQWIGARRSWNVRQAERVFGVTAVIFAVALTAWLSLNRVLSPAEPGEGWGASASDYQEVGTILSQVAGDQELVIVNNPPGFTSNTGIHSIVIPSGGIQALREVVGRYGVTWLVLEKNHPLELDPLYQGAVTIPWLKEKKTLTSQAGDRLVIYEVDLSQ